LTSTLSYSKIGYKKQTENWDTLGWICFTFGYAFLLNVVGILVGNLISVPLALIFFASSWILILIYSIVDINYDHTVVQKRAVKYIMFILIQILFGVFVVLKIL
jgi:hypothetical protein